MEDGIGLGWATEEGEQWVYHKSECCGKKCGGKGACGAADTSWANAILTVTHEGFKGISGEDWKVVMWVLVIRNGRMWSWSTWWNRFAWKILGSKENCLCPTPACIGDGSVSGDLPLWPNWSWWKAEPTWHEEDCIYNFLEKVSSICLKLWWPINID